MFQPSLSACRVTMLALSLLQAVPSAIVIGAFSQPLSHIFLLLSKCYFRSPPPPYTDAVRSTFISIVLLSIKITYYDFTNTKHLTSASGTTIKKFATNSSTHNSMSPEHTTPESSSQLPPSLTLANGPLSSHPTALSTLDGTTAISSTPGTSTEVNVSSGFKTETTTATSTTTVPTSGSVNLRGQIPVGILGVLMVLQALF
ncbi:hypothetical protein BJ912DRAFT_948806 [Pholiota molesta]|nr:hypothetical protein BJ912DRAFT_948806 [Pholiota molesta]